MRLFKSPDGGTEPRWGPKGKELFYLNGNSFMAAEISLMPNLRASRSKVLFSIGRDFYLGGGGSYAVMPDGQRFVFIKRNQPNPFTECILIQNWFEELKRLAPTGKH